VAQCQLLACSANKTWSISHTIGNEIEYIDIESFVNRHTKQDVYDELETGKESSTVDGNWIDKADIVSSGIALNLCVALCRNLHKVQQHVFGATRPVAFLH
jgi:hypothetical protein